MSMALTTNYKVKGILTLVLRDMDKNFNAILLVVLGILESKNRLFSNPGIFGSINHRV